MTRNQKVAIIVGGWLLALVVTGSFSIHRIFKSGVTKPLENLFGDEHLKRAVALMELHKVQYGHYPGGLSEMKVTGVSDIIRLNLVDYCANVDRTAYFVEVRRGWLDKRSLSLPAEFWRDTGYREDLGPCKQNPSGRPGPRQDYEKGRGKTIMGGGK